MDRHPESLPKVLFQCCECQCEELFNLAFACMIWNMKGTMQDIELCHCLNHMKDVRGIVTSLLCRDLAYDYLFPNEVKHNELGLIWTQSSKKVPRHVGDLV